MTTQKGGTAVKHTPTLEWQADADGDQIAEFGLSLIADPTDETATATFVVSYPDRPEIFLDAHQVEVTVAYDGRLLSAVEVEA